MNADQQQEITNDMVKDIVKNHEQEISVMKMMLMYKKMTHY